MATSTQVSLETYLCTVYEPDVDYVDGELEDRNVGHYDHSIVQQQILMCSIAMRRNGASVP